MQLWKRIAALSLVVIATFISLFWITAFTAEEVAQLESDDTTSVEAISATPIVFSKDSTLKTVNKITLHNGRNDWTCLPAISHRPASKHPVRGHAV
jgi:hypothetical protein